MKFVKKYKIELIAFIAMLLMIGGVVVWNNIIDKQNETKDNNKTDIKDDFDLSEVNNIDSVEAKFGYKMKISPGYLLTYTTNKSGVWYQSVANVSKLNTKGGISTITLISDDKKSTLKGIIDSDKTKVEVGDKVNFVGTIDLETGYIELARISKEEIDYSEVTKVEFSKLVKNIKDVKSNIFVVEGYMSTDKNGYKLYDSKDDYQNNNMVGSYFTINWKDKFDYTGNAFVTLECTINGTYQLNNCILVQ